MRLKAALVGDLNRYMALEIKRGGNAVESGVKFRTNRLKLAMRQDVFSEFKSRRLANTWRSKFYKNQGLNAAGVVYTKAPHIMDGFERGGTVQSKDGFWLAIPTPSAPKKALGKRITPANFEKSTGIKLRFIYKPRGPSLLVADGYRASGGKNPQRFRRIRSLKATKKFGARSSLKGRVTVPIFFLVKKTKLKKRISFAAKARAAQNALPRDIIRAWKDYGN